jgi:hypothetical protein
VQFLVEVALPAVSGGVGLLDLVVEALPGLDVAREARVLDRGQLALLALEVAGQRLVLGRDGRRPTDTARSALGRTRGLHRLLGPRGRGRDLVRHRQRRQLGGVVAGC